MLIRLYNDASMSKMIVNIYSHWLVSQFDEGLWQQWPSPSTEIRFLAFYSFFTRIGDNYSMYSGILWLPEFNGNMDQSPGFVQLAQSPAFSHVGTGTNTVRKVISFY